MLFLPAIDLKEGRCVRLRQGRMEEATVFGEDPGAQAAAWQAGGAPYLHLVDLDGAIDGSPRNLAAVRSILASIDIPAELGGGIRNLARIEAYLNLGLDRVILGTAAALEPALVREACAAFPGQIAVGIDAAGGQVAVRGWVEVLPLCATDLATDLAGAGVSYFIYTDIRRDGMMQGHNVEATRAFARATAVPVIASGGIASLDDVRAICALAADGVTGMISGRALYDGALELSAALAVCAKEA
ncbi:MAG: 1-(5-phosphoribosyl)-5-[(5-phosphoribosylamino)methylideneamino]imidazole-4-carboxamide isomerase [Nitrospirae bacterium CG18_big_fil_WC_8_21_14_2_50_70_55]|nr:1-(5-phosphoribosyl)-5-[(5-phosphoribosylamino)methylideneamino]imidazole-4-carboxamide isomerase [Deltaproteobacteria bacterium]OIP63938.1 MAG: 1-(5-phosphoribosyl)-5-[(5-phosphoribosylamino)methylideneamino]imidazole-4-carboxamide isomerase [Nitrospirae bacterium CG2_30_70_394]PIQ05382.1 MAG: 1-(5-phosphoribosyl)-5-[(5-phosphoribosylamino)methylideneamino]imidazole-4-carboxamide isomerase [Nitrospirae bacterium CG18_big_fil_WC_8_21_14_2_50_70_55]PIU80055.1 MAG: 1-(5-phosphoribosyl)-5-[(5-ph